MCNIDCIFWGARQEELNEMTMNPSYHGVAYVYVTAYWAALLGSFHLVATAPLAPPALAILGERMAGCVCGWGGASGWTSRRVLLM